MLPWLWPATCASSLSWAGQEAASFGNACGCSERDSAGCWCHGQAHTCVFLQGRTALEDASSRSAVAGCHPPTSSTTGVCWSKSHRAPAPCPPPPVCHAPPVCVPLPVYVPLRHPQHSGCSRSKVNVHRLMSGSPGDVTSIARSQATLQHCCRLQPRVAVGPQS